MAGRLRGEGVRRSRRRKQRSREVGGKNERMKRKRKTVKTNKKEKLRIYVLYTEVLCYILIILVPLFTPLYRQKRVPILLSSLTLRHLLASTQAWHTLLTCYRELYDTLPVWLHSIGFKETKCVGASVGGARCTWARGKTPGHAAIRGRGGGGRNGGVGGRQRECVRQTASWNVVMGMGTRSER